MRTEQHKQNVLPKPGFIRWAWLSLAGTCIAAGAVGVVLPGIPTTPFLLVAAWAAPKGSPRLDEWIHSHPKFGPMIHAWKHERAIPRSAKVTGIVLMLISLASMWWMKVPTLAFIAATVFFSIGTCFLLWCKEPTQTGLATEPAKKAE